MLYFIVDARFSVYKYKKGNVIIMKQSVLSGAIYEVKDGRRKEEFNLLDSKDRDAFIESHIALAISEAKKYALMYRSDEVVLDDLIQEGIMGLIIAADKFDSNRGIKFSTHAVNWIRSQIRIWLADRDLIIKGPKFYQKKFELTEVVDELRSENECEPILEEIASRMGKGIKEVNELLCHSDNSVGQYYDDRRGINAKLDSVVNDVSHISDAMIKRYEMREIIDFLLDKLSERERKVVEYRCGFRGNGGSITLKQIAQVMGVSGQRVKQIEDEAYSKMREICESEGLEVELV